MVGVNVAVTEVLRIPPASVDPTVKNYHWLDMVKALYAAYARGADTAVLVDGSGAVSEGPGFNVFAVRDDVVSTPETSVLLGVTRQTVFDICAALGVSCQAAATPVEALLAADEVFVTSTAGGVMPVGKVDGRAVGAGGVGPLTKEIMATYWRLHEDGRYSDAVAYPG